MLLADYLATEKTCEKRWFIKDETLFIIIQTWRKSRQVKGNDALGQNSWLYP